MLSRREHDRGSQPLSSAQSAGQDEPISRLTVLGDCVGGLLKPAGSLSPMDHGCSRGDGDAQAGDHEPKARQGASTRLPSKAGRRRPPRRLGCEHCHPVLLSHRAAVVCRKTQSKAEFSGAGREHGKGCGCPVQRWLVQPHLQPDRITPSDRRSGNSFQNAPSGVRSQWRRGRRESCRLGEVDRLPPQPVTAAAATLAIKI